MIYLILFLIAVIILDCQILRLQNSGLFEKTFLYSRKKILLLLLACLLLTLLIKQSDSAIVPYLLAFILGYYLLQRHSFKSQLIGYKADDPLVNQPEMLLIKSDAYGVILGWLFSLMVIGAILGEMETVFPQLSSELLQVLISIIVSSLIVITLIKHASQKFSPKGFWFNVGFIKKNTSLVKTFLFPIAGGMIIAFFSALVVVSRKIQPDTPMNDILESASSSGMLLLFLVLAVVFAPLVEEIIFRGYFFHVVSKIKGKKFAVYFIGLSFAVLHYGQYWGDWLAIIIVTILGLTLTYLRAASGSTIASVLMHYVYNAGVTIIPIFILQMSNPSYFDYMLYQSTYDTSTKERLLVESIICDPDLAEGYNDLAWIYAQEDGRLEEALSLVEKALSYDDDYRPFLDTKADILFEMGRFEEALEIRKGILSKKLSDKNRRDQNEKISEIEAVLDGQIQGVISETLLNIS